MRILLILITISFFSCKRVTEETMPFEKHSGEFSIKKFNALGNFKPVNGLVNLELDYTDAIDSGFMIPSVKQSDGGNFIFSFMLKNNTGQQKNFFYKIYY